MRFAFLFWLLNLAALLPLSAFTADDASRLRLASKSTFSGRVGVLESKGSTVVASDQDGFVVTSLDDGLTWQQLERFTFMDDGQTQQVTLTAGGSTPTAFFIAGSPHSLRSEDGLTWEQIDTRIFSKVGNSAYKDGVLIFTVSSQNVYRSTDDGRTWTLVDENATERARPDVLLAFKPGSGGTPNRYIRINNSEELQYSSDLITWTNVTDPTVANREAERVLYDGNRFVAIFSTITTAISEDGLSWVLVNEDSFARILRNITVNSEFGVFTAESACLDRLTPTDSGDFVFETNLTLTGATTRYAEGNGVLLFFGIEVYRSLPAEGSFDARASENFTPTLSTSDLLPNSDPDNDGRPNLLEYAQGTNPLVRDTMNGQIELIFNLTPPSAEILTSLFATNSDLSTTVQRSSTLNNDWVSSNMQSIVRESDDPFMELRGSRINAIPSDKEFYRLQLSLESEPSIGEAGEFGPR